MQYDLITALLAGLGGMFGWGLADLFAKKTIGAIGDIASLVWAHVFGTILFFVILLLRIADGSYIPNFHLSGYEWLTVILFGALQAVIYYLVYKGFSKGQVSVLNPIFASFTGITALLSILFLGETFTLGIGAALVVIFIGVVFLSIDSEAILTKGFRMTHVPGFKEIITATLLAALWTLFWNIAVDNKDWLVYAFLMYAFMTLTTFIIAKKERATLSIVPKATWKYLVFIGVGEVLAYASISFGYDVSTHTSIIALVSGGFSLPTIFLARIFLKEKTTKLQLTASLVIVAGIALLYLI